MDTVIERGEKHMRDTGAGLLPAAQHYYELGHMNGTEHAATITPEQLTTLDEHDLYDDVGGTSACACGWPNRAGDDAEEHGVLHVLRALGFHTP